MEQDDSLLVNTEAANLVLFSNEQSAVQCEEQLKTPPTENSTGTSEKSGNANFSSKGRKVKGPERNSNSGPLNVLQTSSPEAGDAVTFSAQNPVNGNVAVDCDLPRSQNECRDITTDNLAARSLEDGSVQEAVVDLSTEDEDDSMHDISEGDDDDADSEADSEDDEDDEDGEHSAQEDSEDESSAWEGPGDEAVNMVNADELNQNLVPEERQPLELLNGCEDDQLEGACGGAEATADPIPGFNLFNLNTSTATPAADWNQNVPVAEESSEQETTGFLPTGTRQHHKVTGVRYGSHSDLEQIAEQFLLPHVREGGIILEERRMNMFIVDCCYSAVSEPCQYSFKRTLGQGAQGECCVASDKVSKFQFCVKKIRGDYRSDEIKLMVQLLYFEGFPQIYGAVKDNDSVHIFMQLLEGQTLTSWISQSRVLNREDVIVRLKIFSEILERVRMLSTRGILHEDIKADNIVMTGCEENCHTPNLIDLGLATCAPVSPEKFSVGTVTHFSPEKARSEGHSFPADVYASTTVFVHTLMRGVPLQEMSNFNKVLMRIGMYGPPFSSLPQWLPPCLTRLVRRGWDEDPVQRGTPEEIQAQIQQILTGNQLDELDDVEMDDDDSDDFETSDQSSCLNNASALGINIVSNPEDSDEEGEEEEEEDESDGNEEMDCDVIHTQSESS